MSDEEEHESRCRESFPMCALNPHCSTGTSARCSFPLAIRVQHGARGDDLVCGSAASLHPCHENETLAPGKINAPPRLTSQDISPAPFRLFLGEANLSRALIGRRKSGELSSWLELGLSFGRFLADKTAISSERGRL